MVIEKGKWVVMTKREWHDLKDENAVLKKENQNLRDLITQKDKQLDSLWRAAVEAKKKLRIEKYGQKKEKEDGTT